MSSDAEELADRIAKLDELYTQLDSTLTLKEQHIMGKHVAVAEFEEARKLGAVHAQASRSSHAEAHALRTEVLKLTAAHEAALQNERALDAIHADAQHRLTMHRASRREHLMRLVTALDARIESTIRKIDELPKVAAAVSPVVSPRTPARALVSSPPLSTSAAAFALAAVTVSPAQVVAAPPSARAASKAAASPSPTRITAAGGGAAAVRSLKAQRSIGDDAR